MTKPHHFIIPFAAPPASSETLKLQLTNLPKLLLLLRPTQRIEGNEYQLSMPHEIALAHALGWSGRDGCWPWAAQAAQRDSLQVADHAWGFLTPTHWHTGIDHFTMMNAEDLALSAEESHALFDAVAPLFIDEGWGVQPFLHWSTPTQWYIHHPFLENFPTASLDRVIGRNPDVWMSEPDHPQAKLLRRLQAEIQMTLYTHPINDAREAKGLPPINTVWLSGCGKWQPDDAMKNITIIDDLRSAALHQNNTEWMAAWQRIDQENLPSLLNSLNTVQNHEHIKLTLCGERHAQTYERPPARGFIVSWRQRALSLLKNLKRQRPDALEFLRDL
jgi:hypothetical protein